jgi:hypothetical protein
MNVYNFESSPIRSEYYLISWSNIDDCLPINKGFVIILDVTNKILNESSF